MRRYCVTALSRAGSNPAFWMLALALSPPYCVRLSKTFATGEIGQFPQDVAAWLVLPLGGGKGVRSAMVMAIVEPRHQVGLPVTMSRFVEGTSRLDIWARAPAAQRFTALT